MINDNISNWNLNEYEQWLINNNNILKLYQKALERKDK